MHMYMCCMCMCMYLHPQAQAMHERAQCPASSELVVCHAVRVAAAGVILHDPAATEAVELGKLAPVGGIQMHCLV